MLLSRGAQVNVADMAGNTPLHAATIYGHTEFVKLLLQHAAEVYRKGQNGALAIHMAAHEGHANLVRLFCQFAEVCVCVFMLLHHLQTPTFLPVNSALGSQACYAAHEGICKEFLGCRLWTLVR